MSELAIDKMKEQVREYPNAGYGGGFLCWALGDVRAPYNSWGNGAAMRVSICGWAAKSLEEAAVFSDAVTRVTHNHPEGMAGARIVAECVFLAKTGVPMSEIRDYVNVNYRKIDFTVDEIRPCYDFDISCQGTVPQALACFFESTSFEDAIRNAISLGGDSDTLGSICGAIAGAYWGIPKGIIDATRVFLDDRCKAMMEKLESCFAIGMFVARLGKEVQAENIPSASLLTRRSRIWYYEQNMPNWGFGKTWSRLRREHYDS